MPEEKQRKRRIKVEKLDEWIKILKSTEKVNRSSEYFKQNAIPYLEQYVDSLKEAGRKTVVSIGRKRNAPGSGNFQWRT